MLDHTVTKSGLPHSGQSQPSPTGRLPSLTLEIICRLCGEPICVRCASCPRPYLAHIAMTAHNRSDGRDALDTSDIAMSAPGRRPPRGLCPQYVSPSRRLLFALTTLALFLSCLSALIVALLLERLPHAIEQVWSLSWDQWLFVALWALVSGSLVLAGLGRRPARRSAALLAVASGFVTPWVTIAVGNIEGRWIPAFQDTNGPLDRPLLTLPLVIAAALVPWLAGRASRATVRAD